MRTLINLVYKDYLIMIRDKSGLAMLFIMPMALVLIMTSLQDNTFRSINESGIQLILLNHDNDSLGIAISNEIKNSAVFQVHETINHEKPTEETLRQAVASGKYQIGLVIPENATQKIRDRVKENVALAFGGAKSSGSGSDSVYITVLIDPTTKSTLRNSLQGSIREYAARIESRIVLQELTNVLKEQLMYSVADLSTIRQEIVFYREEYALKGDRRIIPNSVQHNVPAWTLFAMFFIVIPFATSMIKEREDGNIARLLTMPCNYAEILISKFLVFLVICYLQFVLITLMGIYLFPLLNLPALNVGGRFGVLSLMALAASVAAIGYGISIGTIARTHQQAAIFASISVVILAAIGGIWVPVFIMPVLFRYISLISPLNWGLNGFYDILIRGAGLPDVLSFICWLLLFAIGCTGIALLYQFNKISKL